MTFDDEADLRARLRKIEALFERAGTAGEQAAAGAAAERLRERLAAAGAAGEEIRVSIHDPWARTLFMAFCRRYGLRPYRYANQRRQSIVVRVAPAFFNDTLWPAFAEANAALSEHLARVTERIIREEVHADTSEAEEEGPAAALR